MTRYVWNNRLKQRIRFSYWNELCVTGCAGRALLPAGIRYRCGKIIPRLSQS
ncbi:hypothetical protein HL670_02502 [Serratia plymuthica]|jgi:hypothetical protein|nr:hypothetical protein SOD10_44670 [Serratia plymuthica]QJW55616.1 hypothetical protein HL670_02502 [Serratia plymuthica]CAI0773463.1 Uncharacterised protein [Serratia plymuthica]